jgi:hypothetical protein
MAEDDRRSIEAVEGFLELSPGERWAALCEGEPRLVDVEREIVSRSFGRLPSRPPGPVIDTGRTTVGADGAERRIVRLGGEHGGVDPAQKLEEMRNFLTLQRRVSDLIGPESDQTDALLRTVRARDVAFQHLLNAAFEVAETDN